MSDSSSGSIAKDAQSAGWMPLRLAVIAPLSGSNPERPDAPVHVVSGEIEAAMATIAPQLAIEIAGPGGAKEPVHLSFTSLRDFTPASLLRRLAPAADLLRLRQDEPARASEIDPLLRGWSDAILRHPEFRELESAWRGLDFLIRRGRAASGPMAPLLVEAFPAAAGEDFGSRFREQLFDPDYEDRSEIPLAAILLDRALDAQAATIDALRALAGLAATLHVALITGTSAAFFGLKNLAHLPALPDLSTRCTGGAYAAWNAFQREDAARWTCVMVNRFLLRETHEDAETVDPAHPEWLCWGNPCYAAGVSLAASYAEHGHCAASDGLSGTGGHHRLPTRAVAQGMGPAHQVTTEIILADEKAWDLCRAGFTPLLGMSNGDSAYIPFLGNSYRVRPGSLTIEQSLTYQLYAGQLAHVLLKLSRSVTGMAPEAAARWLEDGLFAHFSPFVGDRPGEGVKVSPLELPDGRKAAAITVHPVFKIQEKPIELELQLPLP